jgi:hypothetical protein
MRRNARAAAWFIAAVVLALLGLSLSHLAHSIAMVSGAQEWQAISMAIGIDLGLIALEYAAITSSATPVYPHVRLWIRGGVLTTIVFSMLFNALAFHAGATTPVHQILAVILGLTVPGLIYTAVFRR